MSTAIDRHFPWQTVGRVRITAVMGPRLSNAAPVSGTVYKVGDVVK